MSESAQQTTAGTTTSGGGGGGGDGAGGANTPWGWLGLLKWSLAYSDGTSPTTHSPMSAEDKEFLEKVMKEGIIDENQRMKEILQLVTDGLEQIQQQQQKGNDNNKANGDDDDDDETILQQVQDEMDDLFQELRDIVEQIDYARAFAAMKGLEFLLGCISQGNEIPQPIRSNCLGIVATMASNNPPIQKQLLEMAAIKTLINVYFDTSTTSSAEEASEQQQQQQSSASSTLKFRAKIIQALSAIVRSYDLAEQVFCGIEESSTKRIMLEGLLLMGEKDEKEDDSASASAAREMLQKRTLFFLRALITSDDSNRERVQLFAHSVAYVADHLVTHPHNAEVREMSIALLVQLLEQKHSVNTILDRKDFLVSKGVQQVSALRSLPTQEEKDFASVELEQWEALLVLLARATPDLDETPLMIEAPKPEVEPQ